MYLTARFCISVAFLFLSFIFYNIQQHTMGSPVKTKTVSEKTMKEDRTRARVIRSLPAEVLKNLNDVPKAIFRPLIQHRLLGVVLTFFGFPATKEISSREVATALGPLARLMYPGFDHEREPVTGACLAALKFRAWVSFCRMPAFFAELKAVLLISSEELEDLWRRQRPLVAGWLLGRHTPATDAEVALLTELVTQPDGWCQAYEIAVRGPTSVERPAASTTTSPDTSVAPLPPTDTATPAPGQSAEVNQAPAPEQNQTSMASQMPEITPPSTNQDDSSENSGDTAVQNQLESDPASVADTLPRLKEEFVDNKNPSTDATGSKEEPVPPPAASKVTTPAQVTPPMAQQPEQPLVETENQSPAPTTEEDALVELLDRMKPANFANLATKYPVTSLFLRVASECPEVPLDELLAITPLAVVPGLKAALRCHNRQFHLSASLAGDLVQHISQQRLNHDDLLFSVRKGMIRGGGDLKSDDKSLASLTVRAISAAITNCL